MSTPTPVPDRPDLAAAEARTKLTALHTAIRERETTRLQRLTDAGYGHGWTRSLDELVADTNEERAADLVLILAALDLVYGT